MDITVTKAFKLNLPDQQKHFDVGVHDVDEKIADHWYVKAHCAEKPKKAAKADDPAEKDKNKDKK